MVNLKQVVEDAAAVCIHAKWGNGGYLHLGYDKRERTYHEEYRGFCCEFKMDSNLASKTKRKLVRKVSGVWKSEDFFYAPLKTAPVCRLVHKLKKMGADISLETTDGLEEHRYHVVPVYREMKMDVARAKIFGMTGGCSGR